MNPLFNLILLAMMSLSINAFSQDETDKSKENSEKVSAEAPKEVKPKETGKKFEKVEVVGSRIRRTDFEGPTPIKIIGRKEIEDSPYNSVGDYFRDLSLSSFGSGRETSGSRVAGSSTVNIRGIGSANTLVLLNGVRMQPNGISGSVDLNLIPEIVVGDSQILKGGASAIYGSDALGGVVNMTTRKDFTGVEASTRYTLPEQTGGGRFDISVIGGKQFKNSSVTAAFQYRKNEYIMARDRKWTEAGSDGKNGWQNFGITPAYRNSAGDWKMRPADIAACQADPENQFYVKEGGDDICRYAYANNASNIPEIEQYSAYLNHNIRFNSRTRADLIMMFSQQNTSYIYAPTPASGLKIDKTGPQTWGVFSAGELASMGSKVDFRYRLKEGGNRVTDMVGESYNASYKVERDFGETWSYILNLGYGMTDQKSRNPSGYYLKQELKNVLNSGVFNPYNSNNTIADLGDAPYVPYESAKSINYFVDSSFAGELMELPWGAPLSAAFGLQYNHYYYTNDADPRTKNGDVLGSAGGSGGGNRDIGAAYAEIVLPIFDKVEVQTAARFDWYSDYGTAASPMLAVKYKPARGLMFRSSVSKGFKAPLMQELHSRGGSGFPFFIDHVGCAAGGKTSSNPLCSPQQYLVESLPPSDLKAESAITYNLGVVYAPIKGFSLIVDGWYADISDVIGVSNEQITLALQKDVENGNNNNEQILNSKGVLIERTSGDLDKITVPTQNLSSRRQGGVDVEIAYNFRTSIGGFRIADELSYALLFKQSSFAGLPAVDLLGDFGIPKWRNSISLIYSPTREHQFSLDYKNVAGQKTANRFGKLKTYGELGLTYIRKLPWKAEFKIGVKNLLGGVPPIDEHLGMDPSIYNDWGRYAFFNYRQSF